MTNTGGPPGGDPLEFTREQWEAAHRELVVAPMELIKLVVPGMRERGFGRIAERLVLGRAPADPAADDVELLTGPACSGAFKTLSYKLAGDGITLNTILPGRIATDRINHLHGSIEQAQEVARDEVPAGRLGTAEEIGGRRGVPVLRARGYITGQALLVDGGLVGCI